MGALRDPVVEAAPAVPLAAPSGGWPRPTEHRGHENHPAEVEHEHWHRRDARHLQDHPRPAAPGIWH